MVMAISGPRRVMRVGENERNVGDVERIISVVGGGALAAAALRRGGAAGVALAAVGAMLLHRGSTGKCVVYRHLGVSTAGNGAQHRAPHDLAGAAATVDARQSVKVEHSITIDAARPEAYEYWRNFDNHPRFMPHLRSVQAMVDGRWRYEMAVKGVDVSWESELVNDLPGELIAWKTVGTPAVAHAGSVHFRDTDDSLGTVVTLVMDYEPIGGRPGHMLSKMFGVSPEQMVQEQLRRFKELMESRG